MVSQWFFCVFSVTTHSFWLATRWLLSVCFVASKCLLCGFSVVSPQLLNNWCAVVQKLLNVCSAFIKRFLIGFSAVFRRFLSGFSGVSQQFSGVSQHFFSGFLSCFSGVSLRFLSSFWAVSQMFLSGFSMIWVTDCYSILVWTVLPVCRRTRGQAWWPACRVTAQTIGPPSETSKTSSPSGTFHP